MANKPSILVNHKRVMSVTHKRAQGVESGVVVLVDGSVQLKPLRLVWVGHKQSAIDHNINIVRLLHGFISISTIVPSVWVKKLLLLASHASVEEKIVIPSAWVSVMVCDLCGATQCKYRILLKLLRKLAMWRASFIGSESDALLMTSVKGEILRNILQLSCSACEC